MIAAATGCATACTRARTAQAGGPAGGSVPAASAVATATAVIAGTTSVPPPPEPFAADRPFIFVIRDIPTGAILFVGRVTDPG